MTRVMVAGVFDYFHAGHKFFLREAKKLGDELFVVIAKDQNVEKQKGQKPYFDEHNRLEIVKKSLLANEVLLGDRKNFMLVIEKIKPDIIALGYDQNLPINIQDKLNKNIIIKRIKAKNPDKWKSSLIREKKNI